MVTLFGVLLTVGGLAVAGWLLATRGKIVASFGDARTAVALVAFAVGANAAPVLAGEHSSALIGVLVAGLLAWVLWSGRHDLRSRGGVNLRSRGGLSLRGPDDRWLRVAWVAAAALLVWCVAVDALTGAGLYGSRLVAYAAAGLLLLAGALLAGRAALTTRATAHLGLAVLAVLTIPTALTGSAAWRSCTAGKLEKCSAAGALFKSFFDSENYIALIASFTLVAAVCALRRAELAATTVFCLLIIVATGSRTSYLALAAAGAWLLGSFLLERRRRYVRIHLAGCVALVLASVGVATYLMWTASRTTLSNRGNIWIVAREHLADATATGIGVSKWYRLQDAGDAPTHFFHSGYVLVVFAGGFVALAVWALWATALLHGRVDDGRAFTAKAPVVLLLVYSLTEVVWNPLSVDGLSWILLALMLTRSWVTPAHRPPATGPVDGAAITGRGRWAGRRR
ncbi:O-antigen ligase family protein [Micromonospora sp. NPDC001898]|uniref:O-antigen ligase family protein n=1 Tax=Micromonospora sp. NPDC001898 TaxID=3364221 RepID=UPI0036AE9C43